jgi:hypothetical protein
MKSMYVVKVGSLYELRQTRYAQNLANGKEHPHDVCAVARSIEEMRSMVDKHWPNEIDYSRVEQGENLNDRI